jgi:hypothetical protein
VPTLPINTPMIRREKVRDIVEVRDFTHLNDFAADPSLTTSSYHFTDVTSDLMGKWIEAIAHVRKGRGQALAVAGLRGVGKSHFLATLAALASRSELRPAVRDPHIASSLERFPKRNLLVARVKRGSDKTLMLELRSGLAEGLSIDKRSLSDSLNDILMRASEVAGDHPLLIIIDTVFGREERVDRDDGPLLSEIADAAKNLGIFVGIALDDDVSGADGPNSSIARSFQIHFLDQEHLYRIVDRHIFPKNDSMLPILKDIYHAYQSEVPGFNWSEQRFLPLYPMHPAALEISPLIRLFIHDFALLGFASEAGLKIMGRPADSLIGLDEMFSSVEARLRKNPQLESAFRAFDKLDKETVQRLPVHFRLKAKLILKGLFLLSLEGRPASALTIAASMLVFDGDAPQAGLQEVENLLDRFAADFPSEVRRITDSEGAPKYCLTIGINDDLERAIEGMRHHVTQQEVLESLFYQISEKFPEMKAEGAHLEESHVTVEWRGGMHRGRVVWGERDIEEVASGSNLFDWEILFSKSHELKGEISDVGHTIRWVPSPIAPDEMQTVSKLLVLRKNIDLKHKFAAEYATKLQLLSATANRACKRIFFEDAAVYVGDRKFQIHYDVDSGHGLAHLFSAALTPVFEYLYPSHPYLTVPIGAKEVSLLTADFFGRANLYDPSIQNLARSLAEPLGLAEMGPEGLIPTVAEKLLNLSTVRIAIGDWNETGALDLSTVASRLKSSPFGLSREAQQLLLTALVAQQAIEFVTTSGDRINHRSLDLQIMWDDVAGLSRPIGEKYSDKTLISWIRILTGDDAINSIESGPSEDRINGALQKWLDTWTDARILEHYERLPDTGLNAASWRRSISIRKTLGSLAEIVHTHLEKDSSVRDCLVLIADLFSDSEAEFGNKNRDLVAISHFTAYSHTLQAASKYLAESDVTSDSGVERARHLLISSIEARPDAPTSGSLAVLDSAWTQFQRLYSEFYLQQHNALLYQDWKASLRQLTSNNEWQQFEVYSGLSGFDARIKEQVKDQFRQCHELVCHFEARRCLEVVPYCFCGLRLSDIRQMLTVPDQIMESIKRSGLDLPMKTVDGSETRGGSTTEDRLLILSASLAGVVARPPLS